MAFTRSSLDHLLDVAAGGRSVDGSVDALAAAIAVAADADFVSIFELDPRTRTQIDYGSMDFSEIDEPDGAEEVFWQVWKVAPCSWTSPASPFFGRHPVDEPFAPPSASTRRGRRTPSRRSCASTASRTASGTR